MKWEFCVSSTCSTVSKCSSRWNDSSASVAHVAPYNVGHLWHAASSIKVRTGVYSVILSRPHTKVRRGDMISLWGQIVIRTIGSKLEEIRRNWKQIGSNRKQIGSNWKQIGSNRKQIGSNWKQIGSKLEVVGSSWKHMEEIRIKWKQIGSICYVTLGMGLCTLGLCTFYSFNHVNTIKYHSI